MKTLIIGNGEIGIAVQKVLAPYEPQLFGKVDTYDGEQPEYLHVCFPYTEEFESEVTRYQRLFKPRYTIIHSTVPVGTCRRLNAIHSPVVGIHPFLEQGIQTFTRFLGGEQASEVADYFRRAGLTVYIFGEVETTELMKLLDTQYYALCIEYTKEIKRQCKKHGVPFEAWTVYNEDYNRGYAEQGYDEYVRPTLVPIMKKQGGHCTIPNLELIETVFGPLIKKLNQNEN